MNDCARNRRYSPQPSPLAGRACAAALGTVPGRPPVVHPSSYPRYQGTSGISVAYPDGESQYAVLVQHLRWFEGKLPDAMELGKVGGQVWSAGLALEDHPEG